MEKRSENKDMNVKGHNDSHGGKNKNKIIFIYLLGKEILYGRKKKKFLQKPAFTPTGLPLVASLMEEGLVHELQKP